MLQCIIWFGLPVLTFGRMVACGVLNAWLGWLVTWCCFGWVLPTSTYVCFCLGAVGFCDLILMIDLLEVAFAVG